ncbi:MFS transporter [Vallicoccus soli]|uniref:MFS transporter n=1 Tax=Vallicoccus soli TaxID=2339232 RepID=UPI001C4980B1|nr:MFS transporter [Vallicoccus soli]
MTPRPTLRARRPAGLRVPRPLAPAAAGAPASPRALRAATTAVFALDGAVFGSWAARVPDVAAQTSASPTALGAALLCIGLGALAAMQLTGALCARLGAGLVSAAAALVLCAVAVLPGLAGSVPQLCAALVVFGAASGVLNVAMNSLGVQVEARRARPLLPSLHAAFSLGGLAGAVLGGAAGQVLGVAPHLLLVAGVGLAVVAAAAPVLLRLDARPGALPRAGGSVGVRGSRAAAPLVALGALAGCAAYGEGAVTDWAALHLRETLHAGPAVAAGGYAGFSLAMAVARLAGGGLVQRLGAAPVVTGGAVLAAGGALLAALAPSAPLALAGFVVVGLGLANAFPLAVARAGARGGARGVALSTTVGYAGMLGGPPLLGFAAERAGLPAALASVALLAAAAAALGPAVAPAPRALLRPLRTAVAARVPRPSWDPARGYVLDLPLLLDGRASAVPARAPRPAAEGLGLLLA